MMFVKLFCFILCFNIATIFCRSILREDKVAQALNNWNEDSDVNPEELGEYFEGDIILDPGRSVVSETRSLWPNGVVPYEISKNLNDKEVKSIEKAIETYKRESCIRWVPRKGEKDYVEFNNEKPQCSSHIGRRGGQQTLNLQSTCFNKFGTVLHEMLHAVGFIHEQSRPDRDDYVEIHFENINPSKVHNFEKYKDKEINSYDTKYDYGSVMHYSKGSFSDNGKDTIVPKDPTVHIGQRTGLSKIDLLRLNRAYKCANKY